MTNENKEKLFIGLFLIITALLGMLIVLWFNKAYIEVDNKNVNVNLQENEVNTQNINPSENNASSTKALNDLEIFNSYKQVSIYPNGFETPNDYIGNAEKSLESAGRKLSFIGKFEDVYIYIKAGANNEKGNFTAIKEEFDGIWFYLMDGNFNGGQLDLSKSRFGRQSELTELLYNVSEIPAAENLDEYRKNNFKMFNLSNELEGDRFIGSLVSTQRYGKILELKIGYKCVEDSNCKIELKN